MKSELKNSWSIIRWLWDTSRSLRVQSLLNALIGILGVGLDFAFIAATKLAIDIATSEHHPDSLRLAATILIAIILCKITTGFASKWIAALLGVKSQNRMQIRLFRRLLDSEWNGLEKRHSGDVLNRLERDVRDVTSVITETIPAALGVATRLIGAFFFLYSMAPRLACIIVVIVPLFILVSRIYVRKMRTITREVRDTDSLIQSILQESIQHRMVLKTLERCGTMADKLDNMQSHLREKVRERTIFSSTSGTLLNAGFATGYMVTFLWGVHSLKHDPTFTYGMMIAFIQLVGQIQGPFREMTKFVPVIISAFTASERLMELEEVPVEESGNPIRFQQGAGIRIQNISFAYDERNRHILRNLNFDFPIGSSTAILGETGAGKTTLIRLILSLIHPQEGSIQFYDESQTVPASSFTRCNIVYVPQGNTLFSGTIRENLLLGNPDATEEEMHEALHTACADFVLNLPNGLDEVCGEGGTGLSEGQAQRIAIARAMLRQGCIMLLDEATSALDNETEQHLLQNLATHRDKHRTILFVTHRTAVIDYCDQVLHLEKLRD